jgi:hypothetical protein
MVYVGSRDTLYPQKLALTSPTSDGRSVDIVRLRTKGHGVFFSLVYTSCTALVLVPGDREIGTK